MLSLSQADMMKYHKCKALKKIGSKTYGNKMPNWNKFRSQKETKHFGNVPNQRK